METVVDIGIIDDEELLLDAMRIFFTGIPDLRLVATATNVRDYLTRPIPADVVLLDLNLRDYSDPASNVKSLIAAGYRVIVFSVHGEQRHIIDTTEAGASAYVLKSSTNTAELMSVIREVAAGNSPMTIEHAFSLSRDQRAKRPDLAPREQQVLDIYSTGATLRTTARQMDISESTVKTYLARIKEKYAAAGRPINNRVDYAFRQQEDGFSEESLSEHPPEDPEPLNQKH